MIGVSLSEPHTDEMYVHDCTHMYVLSNGVTHTVNPNDRYKKNEIRYYSINEILKYFRLNVNVPVQTTNYIGAFRPTT